MKCCRSSSESEPSTPEKAKQIEAEVEANPNNPGGRARWSSPTEFMLTCVGYSVGLGNVWRFPYLCYKSGGGAFLIPYVIMMFLIGMPLLFMEYAFGQYFGVGGLTIFKKVCPLFQGVGIGYMVLNGLVCIYYNVIIATALYYLFASLQKTLPWSTCDNPWNTPSCGDPVSLNATSWNSTFSNVTYLLDGANSTVFPELENNTFIGNRTSPSDEYFRLEVLNVDKTHSISNLGNIQWKLCLCLLLAWILVVIFVSRGIKSTGKVAYFTATFPYVMLTVLVIRGVSLPGAQNGILYFVKPEWEQLKSPDVWFGAASQLFYSTNLAWGGMITMASYNDFRHNCFRDAIVINIVSFCTSLYAGFAVFSIIGYMANEYGMDVKEVIKSGPGLAFIAYPRAISLMPIPQLWSVLFFFMLFLLGVGSQMVLIETCVTGLVDEYPTLGLNGRIRFLTTVCVAVFFCVIGIVQTTQGGMYVLQLMDWYSASFSVLIIAMIECIVINWIYDREKFKELVGTCNSRFASNVKEMLGYLPHKLWLVCWKFISPTVILGILIFSFIRYKPAKYGEYYYPAWADGLGWIMCMASVVPIFAVAIYKLIKTPGATFREKWNKATEAQATSSEAIKQSIEANGTEHLGQKIELGEEEEEPQADTPLSKQGTSLV